MPFLFFNQRVIAQAAGIRKDPALPHERDIAWAFYLEIPHSDYLLIGTYALKSGL